MNLFKHKSPFKVERFEYFYDRTDDRGAVWWEISGRLAGRRFSERDLQDLRNDIDAALRAEDD